MIAYNIFIKVGTYTLVLFLLSFIFIGCSCKQPEPQIIYKTKIEVKEVLVEVPCVIPEVSCEFSGSNFEPTVKLLKCLKDQKQAIESCAKKKINN